MAYGIGATILAITVLIYVLFNAAAPDGASQIQSIFYYTSRLFLVLLVQGISIFFLNLYKTTLNNVLYISNEITNHESKRDSLAIALNGGSTETADSMLTSLANTERNFILKKGETSIFDKGTPTELPISNTMFSELMNKVSSN